MKKYAYPELKVRRHAMIWMVFQTLFEDIETDNNSDSDDDLNITLFDDIEKDNELFEPDEESNYMDIEEKEDNKGRTIHLDKINDLIDQTNMLAKTRNDFSKNVDDVCMLMNELHTEIYSDDAWLRFVELNKISTLLDQSFDYVWKMIYGENREKHEIINIDKDKDIDRYVSMYTDSVNDKLELVNRIGELLDNAMIDVQNEVSMINEAKQADEIGIDRLKSIRNTLIKILKKWRDGILEVINRDNACSKPDTKPDTKKKKDTKTDTKKKKDTKPDTKKKKDTKPDTKKNKDAKPDTMKKK